jgi:hypothetical protein
MPVLPIATAPSLRELIEANVAAYDAQIAMLEQMKQQEVFHALGMNPTLWGRRQVLMELLQAALPDAVPGQLVIGSPDGLDEPAVCSIDRSVLTPTVDERNALIAIWRAAGKRTLDTDDVFMLLNLFRRARRVAPN